MEVVSSTGRGREEDKQRRAEHRIFQAEAAKDTYYPNNNDVVTVI
jgi:hypothetical protein